MRAVCLTAAVLHLDEKNSVSSVELGIRCGCMVYLALISNSIFVKQYMTVQMKI